MTDDPMVVLRGVVAAFEERVAAGNEDPASVAQTVKWVVAVLRAHGRRPQASRKPPRGVGYTLDEALIVASLPWFDSMAAAIRHQFPKASPEEVRNHADRIRDHMAAIQSIAGVFLGNLRDLANGFNPGISPALLGPVNVVGLAHNQRETSA